MYSFQQLSDSSDSASADSRANNFATTNFPNQLHSHIATTIFSNQLHRHNHDFQKETMSRLPPRQLRQRLMEGIPTASANRLHVAYDSHINPSAPRNPLMVSDTLTSSTVSENPFESEGSPPDPHKESPAPAPSEQNPGNKALHTYPICPFIDTQHDATKLRDKKRKEQCATHGSVPFQIQLVDIMQKHRCPMTLDDEVIVTKPFF